MLKEHILKLFGRRIRNEIEKLDLDCEKIQEIRIRAGKAIIILENGKEIEISSIMDLVEN